METEDGAAASGSDRDVPQWRYWLQQAQAEGKMLMMVHGKGQGPKRTGAPRGKGSSGHSFLDVLRSWGGNDGGGAKEGEGASRKTPSFEVESSSVFSWVTKPDSLLRDKLAIHASLCKHVQETVMRLRDEELVPVLGQDSSRLTQEEDDEVVEGQEHSVDVDVDVDVDAVEEGQPSAARPVSMQQHTRVPVLQLGAAERKVVLSKVESAGILMVQGRKHEGSPRSQDGSEYDSRHSPRPGSTSPRLRPPSTTTTSSSQASSSHGGAGGKSSRRRRQKEHRSKGAKILTRKPSVSGFEDAANPWEVTPDEEVSSLIESAALSEDSPHRRGAHPHQQRRRRSSGHDLADLSSRYMLSPPSGDPCSSGVVTPAVSRGERETLRKHPEIVKVLQQWWRVLPSRAGLARTSYDTLIMGLLRIFAPLASASTLASWAEIHWKCDCMAPSTQRMDFNMFRQGLLEIAEVWCEKRPPQPGEFVEFFSDLAPTVLRPFVEEMQNRSDRNQVLGDSRPRPTAGFMQQSLGDPQRFLSGMGAGQLSPPQSPRTGVVYVPSSSTGRSPPSSGPSSPRARVRSATGHVQPSVPEGGPPQGTVRAPGELSPAQFRVRLFSAGAYRSGHESIRRSSIPADSHLAMTSSSSPPPPPLVSLSSGTVFEQRIAQSPRLVVSPTHVQQGWEQQNSAVSTETKKHPVFVLDTNPEDHRPQSFIAAAIQEEERLREREAAERKLRRLQEGSHLRRGSNVEAKANAIRQLQRSGDVNRESNEQTMSPSPRPGGRRPPSSNLSVYQRRRAQRLGVSEFAQQDQSGWAMVATRPPPVQLSSSPSFEPVFVSMSSPRPPIRAGIPRSAEFMPAAVLSSLPGGSFFHGSASTAPFPVENLKQRSKTFQEKRKKRLDESHPSPSTHHHQAELQHRVEKEGQKASVELTGPTASSSHQASSSVATVAQAKDGGGCNGDGDGDDGAFESLASKPLLRRHSVRISEPPGLGLLSGESSGGLSGLLLSQSSSLSLMQDISTEVMQKLRQRRVSIVEKEEQKRSKEEEARAAFAKQEEEIRHSGDLRRHAVEARRLSSVMENLQLEEEEDIDPSHPFAPLIQAKRKLREESGDFSEDPLMGLLDLSSSGGGYVHVPGSSQLGSPSEDEGEGSGNMTSRSAPARMPSIQERILARNTDFGRYYGSHGCSKPTNFPRCNTLLSLLPPAGHLKEQQESMPPLSARPRPPPGPPPSKNRTSVLRRTQPKDQEKERALRRILDFTPVAKQKVLCKSGSVTGRHRPPDISVSPRLMNSVNGDPRTIRRFQVLEQARKRKKQECTGQQIQNMFLALQDQEKPQPLLHSRPKEEYLEAGVQPVDMEKLMQRHDTFLQRISHPKLLEFAKGLEWPLMTEDSDGDDDPELG